jgi:hypothetical protein
VAEKSKTRVCGRSLSGIAGSNPAGGMDVCLVWLLCVVRLRSLRRADHSSRGVLPTVVCQCVWSRRLKHEATLARVGQLHQRGVRRVHYQLWRSILYNILRLLVSSPLLRLWLVFHEKIQIFSLCACGRMWECVVYTRCSQSVQLYMCVCFLFGRFPCPTPGMWRC